MAENNENSSIKTITFKAGMSDTDKQTQANSVANQILDKVINGPITIDGEETSLSEKIGDINDALERESQKANVDGNYPTMTVGNADQLNSTVYVVDKVPYLFRTSGGDADIGNRENDKIIGGSLVVNQQVSLEKIRPSQTASGITTTNNNDGTVTLNGTTTELTAIPLTDEIDIVYGHKYFVTKGKNVVLYDGYLADGSDGIIIPLRNRINLYGLIEAGITINETIPIQLIDLTQMFDSTIANYIYALEQANAGAGVAWFKNYFQKLYYPYNTGSLLSVKLTSHDTVGFNQWDEQWEVGGINNNTGLDEVNNDFIRSKSNDYQPCIPDTTYYGKASAEAIRVFFYDKNKNYISNVSVFNATFTAPSNAYWFRLKQYNNTTHTYDNDICINLSWSGWRNGQYEPYKKNSYPLDTTVELRGIPKLDSNNHLYFDGDEYSSVGKKLRRYGSYTFTGNEVWTKCNHAYYSNISGVSSIIKGVPANTVPNIICESLIAKKADRLYTYGETETGIGTAPNGTIWIAELTYQNISSLTGKTIVFELAEPVEEDATPFQEPQIVDDFGTEEYVVPTQNGWEIPVGHDTKYPANLRDKLQRLPDMPSVSQNVTETYVVDYNGTTKKCTFVGIDAWLDSNGYKKSTELPTIDAVGGTLRQMLAISQSVDFLNTDVIDLGSLNWENYLGTTGVFRASVSGIKGSESATNNGKILCSKYKTDNIQNVSSSLVNNSTAINNDGTKIYIIDTSFRTDATTFKNAMKGVLLAYEKA